MQTHQENTFFTCRPIKKTPLGTATAVEARLLHNGVTCPARTVACQSNKDGSGPAMVILGPLSNTGSIPISVSTMTLKFPAMDSEVLLKKAHWIFHY